MLKKVSRKRNPINKDRNRLRNVMSDDLLEEISKYWFSGSIALSNPDDLSSGIVFIKQGYTCEENL